MDECWTRHHSGSESEYLAERRGEGISVDLLGDRHMSNPVMQSTANALRKVVIVLLYPLLHHIYNSYLDSTLQGKDEPFYQPLNDCIPYLRLSPSLFVVMIL